MATEFELGTLVGLLIGGGHFGGDGRQPQITLRMHVRHEAMFRWIERTFPGGRLYGPYHHDGRHYFQWMARGLYLREVLVPLLNSQMSPTVDAHSYERFTAMQEQYGIDPGRIPPGSNVEPEPGWAPTDSAASATDRPAAPDHLPVSGRVDELFDQLRRERPEPD